MSEDKTELARVALVQRAPSVRAPFAATVEELAGLAKSTGVPPVDLSRVRVPLALLELIPREAAKQHGLLPIRMGQNELTVAMHAPNNSKAIDELEFVTGKNVVVLVAPEEDLQEAANQAYSALGRGEKFYEGPRFVAEDAPSEILRTSQSQRSEPTMSQSVTRAEHSKELSGLEPGFAAPLDVRDRPAAELVPEPPPLQPAFEIPDLEPGGTAASAHFPESALASSLGQCPETSSETLELDEESRAQEQQVALLVEDDEDIRNLVARLLQRQGLHVIQVADGARALQELKLRRPDLMVLDAMLPEVHGFEVARRVKSSSRHKELPIIMLTAVHRGWRYAEDLRELGVEHYIEKPFEARVLTRAVDEALARTTKQLPIAHDALTLLEAGVAALKRGEFDVAEKHLKAGVEVDPLAHQIHFHLGLLYGKSGRPYEAMGAIEHSVKLNPRYFSGVKNLAILYQKTGFKNKSAEMWERALSLALDEDTRNSIRNHLHRLL